MKEVSIHGANYFGYSDRTRGASRAVILQNGQILLSCVTTTDLWMLPGGGHEAGETPVEACKREVAEETGVLCDVGECFLILHEFYENWEYISYFFKCSATGMTERRLTEGEKRVKLEPVWLPLDQAVSIFSGHSKYDGIDEDHRGIYLREWTALEALMKTEFS